METSPQNHIEAFYDLPGVEGVTKFVHWIDAQLMAWSAFFLILSLVLIGLDNTTSYVSKSGFLSGLLGLAFAISVESQGRILLKYARMSWDNGSRAVAFAWAISAMPVVAVAFVLAWSYMVKAAEGVTYAQATQIIGLGVRDVEFGRAATLIYLVCMSALAYFVKPRESTEHKVAMIREQAAIAEAEAEVIRATQVKRDAQMWAAAKGALGARQVGAAAFLGREARIEPGTTIGAHPAQSLTSATDRAFGSLYEESPVNPLPASAFYSANPDDDETPPDGSGGPTGGRGGAYSGRASNGGVYSGRAPVTGFGARGRPSTPVTQLYGAPAPRTGTRNELLGASGVADVKNFLLNESDRFAQGARATVPTQQDVLNHLNDLGYGLRGVTASLKYTINQAMRAITDEGIALAWEEQAPVAVNY